MSAQKWHRNPKQLRSSMTTDISLDFQFRTLDGILVGTYFPVSYNKYSHLRAGISLRLGPLIIGTSDILPLITKKNIYGLDFHFLLKVPHISFNKKNKNPRNKSKFEVNKEKN